MRPASAFSGQVTGALLACQFPPTFRDAKWHNHKLLALVGPPHGSPI